METNKNQNIPSFTEFVEKYFPVIPINPYSELLIKHIKENFSTGNKRTIVATGRYCNPAKYWITIAEAISKVNEGKNVIVATGDPELYVSNAKILTGLTVVLEETYDVDMYKLKIFNK